MFEATSVSFRQTYYGCDLASSYVALVVDAIVYFIIAAYLEQINPGEFGVEKKFYFPFTFKFWRDCLAYSQHVEPIDKKPVYSEQLSPSQLYARYLSSTSVNPLTVDEDGVAMQQSPCYPIPDEDVIIEAIGLSKRFTKRNTSRCIATTKRAVTHFSIEVGHNRNIYLLMEATNIHKFYLNKDLLGNDIKSNFCFICRFEKVKF